MRFRKALQVVAKTVQVIVFALALALVAIALRLWWANSTPSRPKALPVTAVWYPAPTVDISPRGYWLACWVDRTRNVNRCKLTDYRGRNPKFEADYSPLYGSGPIPEERLYQKPVSPNTNLWAVAGRDFVPIVRLKDGTILVPTRDLAEFRQHPPSGAEP
jgi:hypothetical protein